jgi:endonuclease/exonuclease/phosphatase family metal-dependent hydrolase
MKVKTLTWNIGGGKLLKDDADPALLASYAEDGLAIITDLLRAEAPDIIALQETEQKQGYDQVKIIAQSLGYEYYFHDATSASHIDTDCQLGHAVISKYPISEHHFAFFDNPKVEIVWEDGSVAKSFDKGFSNCLVTIGETHIGVTTLHLVPFRRFNIELQSAQGQKILQNVADMLSFTTENALVQGDFNIGDSTIEPYLPSLFNREHLEEVAIDEPTTPKGRSYDHVLYRGLTFESKRIISSVKTDHYPVVCTFEI